MTTKTDEQERAEFMSWLTKHYYYDDLNKSEIELAKDAWDAGRAALQSLHETQLQVWRSTDSCGEFWSWVEADQYDYDRAKPEDRRAVQIIKEG